MESENDELNITPLGAGQEVGRSCIMLEFKGKKIMLDCGIHPGLTGMDALPFIDMVEVDTIDLLLISHFHLDHCGALPWFLTKTTFRGRCFMTHATKAIYRALLADCIKVSNEQILYTEADLELSMSRIETVNFHELKEVNAIKFTAFNAGHVLGAAQFMIEIAGVKTLYTGDFSRQEDRHLMSAEIPPIKPEVLIIESTYGTHIHEPREARETRFCEIVHSTIKRAGRCLIPVFALGRAQELLLILDEYWSQHPELHEIPIYYASLLAKKCMSVYQTYISAMNDRIKKQIAINNPFVFKHISNLKSIDHFEDCGPCVIMATPGMLQSGLSRELFEAWCGSPENSCIIAGYCVEGTLAKQILAEPEEIVTLSGTKIPRRCQIEYISFSAHTDYCQTSEFIRTLRPPHIVLVHGEANEMGRLKAAINREYEDDLHAPVLFSPKNTERLSLRFRGEKTAKVTLNDIGYCKRKLLKSLSSSRLDTGLTEPEASFLVQSDEDLLNLLNVYCCVNSHNDSDYIEQLSSGVGFSKSCTSDSSEPSIGAPEDRCQSSSSDSESEEKSFRFLEENSNLGSDEAEEMEADQNEEQGEFSFQSDQDMDDGEQCDEYSEEEDAYSDDASPF